MPAGRKAKIFYHSSKGKVWKVVGFAREGTSCPECLGVGGAQHGGFPLNAPLWGLLAWFPVTVQVSLGSGLEPLLLVPKVSKITYLG